MTIEDAIRILSDSANVGMTTFNQEFKDAERLGIEALEAIRSCRQYPECLFVDLLPGETKE